MKISRSGKITIGVVYLIAISLIITIFLLNGPGNNPKGQIPYQDTGDTEYSSDLYPPDASFEISEYQEGILRNMTIIHVTDDDLGVFPALKKIFETAGTNTRVWRGKGQRLAGNFEANMTQYSHFNHAVCNNVTLDICFANPPLYEYNGKYFLIFSEYYHSHSTARPTTVRQTLVITDILS